MSFLTRTTLAVASLAAVAQALPKVSPVDPDHECLHYGGIDEPFELEINQCTNSTTGDPCSIEGYRHGVQVRANIGDTRWNQGFIIIPDNYKSTIKQENPLACGVGSRSITYLSIDAPTSKNTTGEGYWSMEEFDDSDTLMWGYGSGARLPIPYHHEKADGTLQGGVFMGFNWTSTWAVKLEEPAELMDAEPYWSLRFLGVKSEDAEDALEEGESSTFLKVHRL